MFEKQTRLEMIYAAFCKKKFIRNEAQMAKILRKSRGPISKLGAFTGQKLVFLIIAFRILRMEFKFEYKVENSINNGSLPLFS